MHPGKHGAGETPWLVQAKWISSTFKIDIDTVRQLLLNVETIERETNDRFQNLANAFRDLKITLTKVKYLKST